MRGVRARVEGGYLMDVKCDLCPTALDYQVGNYPGHRLLHYDMMLCGTCYALMSDGILRDREGQFESHLQSHGIAMPSRQKNGLYPRGQ